MCKDVKGQKGWEPLSWGWKPVQLRELPLGLLCPPFAFIPSPIVREYLTSLFLFSMLLSSDTRG